MGSPVNEQLLRPFLSKFLTPRTGGACIPGAYSREIGMWSQDTPDRTRPIIDGDPALSELTTKTATNQEQDQLDMQMLELVTKTATQVERDDDMSFSRSAMLELTTKTDAELERDDTAPSVIGFL